MKDVMIVTGAGQLSMAIARRMGYEMKIVVGDKSRKNADNIVGIMMNAGFDAEAMEMDLSDRTSIRTLIEKAQEYGAKVVTCSDSSGYIYDPNGIDLAALKEASKPS